MSVNSYLDRVFLEGVHKEKLTLPTRYVIKSVLWEMETYKMSADSSKWKFVVFKDLFISNMPDINSFRVCSIALALCDCIESNLMVLWGRFIKKCPGLLWSRRFGPLLFENHASKYSSYDTQTESPTKHLLFFRVSKFLNYTQKFVDQRILELQNIEMSDQELLAVLVLEFISASSIGRKTWD